MAGSALFPAAPWPFAEASSNARQTRRMASEHVLFSPWILGFIQLISGAGIVESSLRPTTRLTAPAPLMSDMELRRYRRVRCVRFVRWQFHSSRE